jgi:hypothetical protein
MTKESALSNADRDAALARYIERAQLGLARIESLGIRCTPDLDGIGAVLNWCVDHVSVSPTDDRGVPDWIRDSETHKRFAFSIDPEWDWAIDGGGLLLATLLLSQNSKLRWSIGDPRFASAGQVVLSGFRRKQEFAPSTVFRSLIRRARAGEDAREILDLCVTTWVEQFRT